jgi:AraC-like DNA-binding protein
MRVPLSGTRVDVFVFGREFLGEDPLGRGMPWITPFIADPSERPRADLPEARKRVLVRAQILWQEVTAKRPDWQSVVRHDLLCLLTDLVREWAPTEGIDVAVGASAARLARVLPALNLVHARLSERVTVRDAASACGLSASRFQVVFRRIVGSSFGEYGLRARVLHAAQLLLHTDRTLSAIAREAGFIDDSHMRRRFVAHYGCTPAEYRRVRLLHARMHAREL